MTETRAEKGVEIAIDDDHEPQRIRLGGTAAAMGIKTRGGGDIETAVVIVKEDEDIRPKNQIVIDAHADTGLEITIRSATVARWPGVGKAL